MMNHDIANTWKWEDSHTADDVTADANGRSLDCQDCDSTVLCILTYGTNPGDDTTLDVKLQESADNVTFTDITGATMTQVAGDTENSHEVKVFHNRAKRYVRAVVDVGGSSIAIGHVGVVLASPKSTL